MISSAMFSVIGQAFIPIPAVGGLIGGMVGYALSSATYGILTSSLKEAKLAHAERIAIEKACEEHIKMIREYRAQINAIIEEYLTDSMEIFQDSFDGIKEALAIGDVDLLIESANSITDALGGNKPFETMDEFNEMMLQEQPLNYREDNCMYKMNQAKLYYLFMMSDGDVSPNEKKIFNSICKELSVDSDNKNTVIKECKEIAKKEALSCLEVLKKNIEDGYMYGILDLDISKYESDSVKASVLWNLINLGYADTYFTIDEREVVDALREYWEISKSLYQEMIDVAETILSLEKYKTWVENTLTEDDGKSKKIKQIKKDIKFAQDSIKTTISEFDY